MPKNRNDIPMSILPVPDPSILTTRQILREVSILDDKLAEKISQRHREEAALERLMDARFKAIEKTVDDHVDWSQGLTGKIDRAVAGLQELVEEKFAGVDLRFTERDVRTDQASTAGASALAAALQAAKELVGAQGEATAAAAVKSETAVTKQIDQIIVLIQNGNAASDARITELKERIDRGEGSTSGAKDVRTERRADMAQVIAVSGIIAALVGGVLTAITIKVFGG